MTDITYNISTFGSLRPEFSLWDKNHTSEAIKMHFPSRLGYTEESLKGIKEIYMPLLFDFSREFPIDILRDDDMPYIRAHLNDFNNPILKKRLRLLRFLIAQKDTYEQALNEVKSGKKVSHWIWYIFPQMKGLGHSAKSQYYGITDRDEAIDYINTRTLRIRLKEITKAVYDSPYSVYEIFGDDAIKVKSCMQLFASVSDIPIFDQMIKKYNW